MAFGVHSEVGALRKVMVHRPGLEHTRLTPSKIQEDGSRWNRKFGNGGRSMALGSLDCHTRPKSRSTSSRAIPPIR